MNKAMSNATFLEKLYYILLFLVIGFGILGGVAGAFIDTFDFSAGRMIALTFVFFGAVLIYLGGFITKDLNIRKTIWISGLVGAFSYFTAYFISLFAVFGDLTVRSRGRATSFTDMSTSDRVGGGHHRPTEVTGHFLEIGGLMEFLYKLSIIGFMIGVFFILYSLFMKFSERADEFQFSSGTLSASKILFGAFIILAPLLVLTEAEVFRRLTLMVFIILLSMVLATYQSYYLLKTSRKVNPNRVEEAGEQSGTEEESENEALKRRIAVLEGKLRENEGTGTEVEDVSEETISEERLE